MGWFKTLVSFITDPIADLTGGYVERKRIAAEMAADVARAENNFKIAQFNAKAKRCMQAEQNDADYDLLVLKNRDKTLMDEVIILFFLGLFVCHLYRPCNRICKKVGRLWVMMVHLGTLNL